MSELKSGLMFLFSLAWLFPCAAAAFWLVPVTDDRSIGLFIGSVCALALWMTTLPLWLKFKWWYN